MKLGELREYLGKDKSNHDLKLISGDGELIDDIVLAKSVVVNGENKDLDELTEFSLEGKPVPLRVVIHCWLHRNSSAADYLADCRAKNFTNVSFLHRNDLIQWLSGESETSQYVSTSEEKSELPDKSALQSKESNAGKAASAQVKGEVFPYERAILDHNSSLRGSKPTNFQYLIKEAELKLVHSFKSATKSKSGTSGISKPDHSKAKPSSQKDPIILIPSAASSIFTIANIRQFLEESKYVNPKDLPISHKDLVTAVKKFDRISRPIRFLIVNNTKLFTQPEYWDRVVAIFTTGHEWQFTNYQWSNPAELFQHCKGFYFHFSGDLVPRNAEQWNVQKLELDKNKRFKDIEVSRFFWTIIERELLARGYH
ncbi:Cdc73p [Kluyveromyces lactis]|uniref:KLLA0D03036p n=1 Tax=Kluyveromyces lactis (strain ATCC 8585 / CBS 2359 / DSM 70799 / NBRC 1267 / NRRL Y-1140 / WM37) TaxID=284590 RepID=Q6CS86_KLULA|nr:uncharacterized protein KLLA0_D03036g [Kluyveromyces lactis]CAH00299.1 KLLA0D03036p [Kluyveromyces lactis]|eukprot:XP_453203.1 uncharacterized protein KLLA0_D03036g [Kluyveromyces lactis]